MKHNHTVADDDLHFSIDAETRTITHPNPESLILVRGDHNSERFSFEMDRYIDGHDTMLCDKVQVHYINVDGEIPDVTSSDIYTVDDMALKDGDDEKITCSWLIANTATLYAGTLSFALRFSCTKDSKVVYVWNTAPYSGVVVSNGVNSSDEVVSQYGDVLDQWYSEFLNAGTTGVRMIDEAIPGAIEEVVEESKKRITADVLRVNDILVQEVGYSEDKVMSQAAVSSEIDALEARMHDDYTEITSGLLAKTAELQDTINKMGEAELPSTGTGSVAGVYTYDIKRDVKYKVYGLVKDGVSTWRTGVRFYYDAIVDGFETTTSRDIPLSSVSSDCEWVTLKVHYEDGALTCAFIITIDGQITKEIHDISSNLNSIVIYDAKAVYQVSDHVNFAVNANGIAYIYPNGGDALCNTYTIVFDDGRTFDFDVRNGDGVTSVERTNRGEHEDTYTMRFISGKTTTFTVPNAGSVGVKKTVTGQVIRVDDVNPLEHVVKVNLESKNLLPMSEIDSNKNETFYETNPSYGSILIDSTPTSGFDIELYKWSSYEEFIGTYTMSIGAALPKGSYFWIKDTAGNKKYLITYYANGAVTNVVELNGKYSSFGMWVSADGTFDASVFYPQLERGTVATEHIPYVDVTKHNLHVYGKNILPLTGRDSSKTEGEVTVTPNDDGTITINGTATGDVEFTIFYGDLPVHGTYVLSGLPDDTGDRCYFAVSNNGANFTDVTGSKVLEWTNTKLVEVLLHINEGATFSDVKVGPQLEVGDTATEYEPYQCKTYPVNLSGSVSNVLSVAPTMTISPNRSGVNVKMEYLRDINKVVESIGNGSGSGGGGCGYTKEQIDAMIIRHDNRITRLENEIGDVSTRLQKLNDGGIT